MLLEFSVGNFWSFKEIQTLQMRAAKIKSKFPKVDEENVFVVNDKLSLLKSKAVYGANASGKTNLVRAFSAMRGIVKENIANERVLENTIIPFKFNETTIGEPSFLQLVFVLEGVQYRYGFEATKKEIASEWLFGKPLNEMGVRERYYFIREGNQVDVNEEWFKEGANFAKSGGTNTPYFRTNSLFLTVVAAFNGSLALKIVRSIVNKVSIITGMDDNANQLEEITMNLLAEDATMKQKLTEILNSLDPTILSIDLIDEENVALADFPDVRDFLNTVKKKGHLPARGIAVNRKVYDDTGKATGQAALVMSFQEAEGTKKFFALSPQILTVLEQGGILFVDEFDARFHPRLTKKIVQLFHSKRTNPSNAQLIFVTHDSTLLDAHLLRRDQIAFSKKNKYGATVLFSLVEFKGVRNDASFEKDYLSGSYGAIPNNLNIMDSIFETTLTHA